MHAERLIFERRSKWSRAWFDQWAESGAFEGRRVELVQGELVEVSPQGAVHAYFIQKFTTLLAPLSAHGVLRVQLPLVVDEFTELVPDFTVTKEPPKRGAPHPSRALLVIEVSDSSATFDRLVKAPLYARTGTREYWLVDIGEETVEVSSAPKGGRFIKHRRLSKGRLSVPGFDHVVIDLEGLFDG